MTGTDLQGRGMMVLTSILSLRESTALPSPTTLDSQLRQGRYGRDAAKHLFEVRQFDLHALRFRRCRPLQRRRLLEDGTGERRRRLGRGQKDTYRHGRGGRHHGCKQTVATILRKYGTDVSVGDGNDASTPRVGLNVCVAVSFCGLFSFQLYSSVILRPITLLDKVYDKRQELSPYFYR